MTSVIKPTFIIKTVNITIPAQTTNYKEVTQDVSETGLKAVGVVGWRSTQATYNIYRLYVDASAQTLYAGVAREAGLKLENSVTIRAHVMYV